MWQFKYKLQITDMTDLLESNMEKKESTYTQRIEYRCIEEEDKEDIVFNTCWRRMKNIGL